MKNKSKVLRLAIITSHPIQYNAPLFALLSARIDIDVKVFYSWQGPVDQTDPEFEKKIIWDIPLLEGYEYCFVKNSAKDPGTHHIFGLDNPSMSREVENWGANALLIYGWPFKTHLSVMYNFHGRIPVYFRGDSTLLTAGNKIKKLCRKILLTWIYHHVDVAFYPGQCSKEYYLAHGMSNEKLFHVPHSIDNERFSSHDEEREIRSLQWRREMGISDRAIVLLFAGKLVPRKQPGLLLNVVKEIVSDRKIDIHLLFVGTGPLEDTLIELSDNSHYIHFLGFRNQTEMPLVYRLANIYVLPSVIETWGLGVNEALACGRPVLVSDKVGCAKDIVKSGITGEIFVAEDKAMLRKTLEYMISNKRILDVMRYTSKVFIANWSVESAAKIMGNHLSQLNSKNM